MSAGTSSWLLSCHRCQNMIDVPDAGTGLIYTCGICHTQMEVVDGERGLTRLPTAAQATPLALPPAGGLDFPGDAPGFVPRSFPTPQPVPRTPVAMPYDFPLPGHLIDAELGQNVHGRRLRVIASTGEAFQALIVAPDLAADGFFRAHLRRAVELASGILTPFVVPIHRVESAKGSIIYLFRDIPGLESMGAFLRRHRVLDERVAITILRKLATILAEADRCGLPHGWLRPDVVLLSSRRDVVLDELGVAVSPSYLLRKLHYPTQTSFYLPPEYLDPMAAPSLAGDVFTLGCLLFRMLTGQSLLKATSAEEALTGVLTHGIPPLSSVREDISPSVAMLFAFLTAPQADERLTDHGDIVERCDRILNETRRITKSLHRSA